MKKLISRLLIMGCFLFCLAPSTLAQKKLTQGKAVFTISYPESELDQQTLSMMPSESVVYFKDQRSRAEMKIAMGTTVAITDARTGAMTTLMDMMGNKIAMKFSKEELEKEKLQTQKPELKNTSDTKKIAGFNCKKVQMIFKDDSGGDVNMDIWFTDEIAAPNSMRAGEMNLDQIDGFMMEFETKMNTLTMKMICRSVTEENVSDSMFGIPDGYSLTTMDEMKKLGGIH